MFGIGLGFARETNNYVIKFIAPVFGLIAATFLHYAWNLTGYAAEDVYYYFYFLFMVPAFVGVIILIWFQLGREGNVICDYLRPEIQSGVVTENERKSIATVGGRVMTSIMAFLKGGIRGWTAQHRFRQVAAELAFQRYRVDHGQADRDEALEAAFVQRLRQLAPRSAY